MPADEFKSALRAVWIIVSGVLLAILAAPWILSAQQLSSLTPRCERKARYGTECFCCGMTTAFLRISKGHFREAERANRGSLPLYAGFVLNETSLLFFLKRRVALKGRGANGEKNASPC